MRRRVFGAALVALTVAGSSAAVAGQAQAGPVVLHVPGDVHLVTELSGSYSTVAHTIRHADGSWDGFGTVNFIQYYSQMASTIVNGEEHLVYGVQMSHPPLYSWIADRIRHADGTWSDAGSHRVGDNTTRELAVTALSGELHVVRRAWNQPVRHHVRHADGTWSDLPDLPAPTAELAGSVAVAGHDGELRLLYIGPDLATLSYYTAQADGVWSPAAQVPFSPAPGVTPVAVEAAQVGTDLHAVVRGSDGLLYHAKRDAAGAWAGFRPIGSQVPVPANVSSVSVTVAGGVLHVAVSADGGLFHSVRFANGTWQPFGDVLGEAGRWVRAGAVSIAGS